jgi:hypothetical protein
MVPIAERTHDSRDMIQAVGYPAGVAALGVGLLIFILVDAAEPHQHVHSRGPVRKETRVQFDQWQERVACPRPLFVAGLRVELRRPDGEAIALGETDRSGQLTINLREVDLSGMGGAKKATVVVDGRDAGEADLTEAAPAR